MTREYIGKYRVVSRIGRGGMGVVYKAHDPDLDRSVALKVIAVDVDVSEEIRVRFFHEAQACARLVHPNIVTIYDLGKAEDCLFIAMELLEGRELRHLIAEPGSLSLRDKLGIVVQLCDGLAYAHQNGIVHRDIKPANIFVQQNGHVKILDFGVARMGTDPGLTRTGLIVGTLRYAAPERLRGRGDDRSDIFSIGAVLYELLTGRPAFPGDDQIEILEQICSHDPPAPSTLDPSLGPDLDRVVMRALHKDPAQRFGSVRLLARELVEIQRRMVDAAGPAASRRTSGGEDTVMFGPGLDRLDETVHFANHARFTAMPDRDRSDVDSQIERVPTSPTGVSPTTNGATPAPTSTPDTVVSADPRTAAHTVLEKPRDADVSTGVDQTDPGLPEHADGTPSPVLRDGTTPPPRVSVTEEIAAPPSPPITSSVNTTAVPLDDVVHDVASGMPDGSQPAVAGVTADAAPRRAVDEPVRAPTRRGRRWMTWDASALRARSSLLRSRRAMLVAGVVVAGVAVTMAWGRLSGDHGEDVTQVESGVATARLAAVSADAPALAGPALASADEKAGEAKRLVSAGRPGEALNAYRAAVDAYGEATRLAERNRAERTQADQARQALRAAKQRARQDHPEFTTAVERERQGENLYARLAFKDAAAGFAAATDLFVRAAVVVEPEPVKPVPTVPTAQTPTPAPTNPSADIQAVLDAYVKAIERKDLVALRTIRPGLTDGDLQRWAASFEITRSRKVDLKVEDITVDGKGARATGRRRDTTVLTNGQKIQRNTRFVYMLSRGSRSWILQEMNEIEEGAPSPRAAQADKASGR
jgi:serine/threonine protein kinase